MMEVHHGRCSAVSWKEAVFALVRDREVTGEMFRVLLVLLAAGNGTEVVYLSQRELGEICDMKQQNVGRAIAKLCDKGIVEKEYRQGRVGYAVARYFGRGEGRPASEPER
jgi:hypothetical protein